MAPQAEMTLALEWHAMQNNQSNRVGGEAYPEQRSSEASARLKKHAVEGPWLDWALTACHRITATAFCMCCVALSLQAGPALAQHTETTTNPAGPSASAASAPIAPVSASPTSAPASAGDVSGPSISAAAESNTTETSDALSNSLNNSPAARPSLDYEPTETISEDSSVSFPVDI